MAKPGIVEVEWVDARSVYECMSYADARLKVHLSERVTVGYVVDKTKEHLLIAGTYDPLDEYDKEGGCDYTIIPRGWVKKVTELAPVASKE